MSAISLYRGESRTITLTVNDPTTGDRANLSTGSWQLLTCEFQVKTAIDAPDPALISKSMAGGITVLTQSGATKGQLQIQILPTDTSSVASGAYYYDIVGTFSNGERLYLVRPTRCMILGVVNQL